MSYQVIARKWRPQKFDDVVGQQAVTRTLRNALASRRLAQAFVFAGPRGVGKTTSARILARALNCVNGPTPDPCGVCDACVEIAEGRDIDVLEIDAATHTGVDNVREVIIEGLAIMPVRNRYKVFIIDEVHQLSNASFNALLKSIEEPPPHVVFMMATTELDKIPETVLSRSQVYEFRTISSKSIADQLRRIVDAEGIAVSEESLQLIARDAEGSMRDAQSKLDQVIAFTGKTITVEDVATVLGLVGRDLLLDTIQAVVDEDAPAAFALTARAVEMGYDLRAVCRELSRVVRDLLVLSVDPTRVSDPEIAGEGERERLQTLAGRFSREDLLRAFDLLTRTEFEIRGAAQPRYHLEMGLLRWIHLRKLAPIEDVIQSLISGTPLAGPAGGTRPAARPAPAIQPAPTRPADSRTARNATPAQPSPAAPGRPAAPPSTAARPASAAPAAAAKPAPAEPAPAATAKSAPAQPEPAATAKPSPTPSAPPSSRAPAAEAPAPASSTAPAAPLATSDAGFRDALLAEVKKAKVVFYNTVVAQAQKVEVTPDGVVFTFAPAQKALLHHFEQTRPVVESIAQQLAGRKVQVTGVLGNASSTGAGTAPQPDAQTARKNALREQAMDNPAVQALLEVFPAEIRDVEEIEKAKG